MKKSPLKLSLVFSFLIATSIFSSNAEAVEATAGRSFKKIIADAQKSCPTLACAAEPLHLTAMSCEQIAKLPGEANQQLSEIAWNLAQIWGDTILEGDYEAHQQVVLDQVQQVMDGKKVIGYRITYSSKAWDISNCDYDAEKPGTLKDCVEGRISESGFVSKSMKDWFRDDHAYAEFTEK